MYSSPPVCGALGRPAGPRSPMEEEPPTPTPVKYFFTDGRGAPDPNPSKVLLR